MGRAIRGVLVAVAVVAAFLAVLWFRPPEPWAVWQVHGLAHIDGIEGDVDLDVGRLP